MIKRNIKFKVSQHETITGSSAYAIGFENLSWSEVCTIKQYAEKLALQNDKDRFAAPEEKVEKVKPLERPELKMDSSMKKEIEEKSKELAESVHKVGRPKKNI